jgi:hypothetical protein
MLAIKLGLVAASVLLSTLAARRFGHAVGGAVAGMPMIAAPIIAILLIDHSVQQVQAIALATLVCLPAAIAHIVTFARAAARFHWGFCLFLAIATYGICGALLTALELPVAGVCVLALAAPALGLRAVPQGLRAHGAVSVPRAELVLRIAAALAMAAAVIAGADALPASISGLLLAVPITGSVLPCFTLPRHGPAATASLMGGFVQGLNGFAAFFVALYFGLAWFDKAAAFCLALGASLAMALVVQGLRRFVQNARHASRSLR